MPAEELVLSQPRSGAPEVTSPATKRSIIKMSEDKLKQSTRKTTKQLKRRGKAVSRTTVRRILRKEGLTPYRRQKQPYITRSNEEDRIEFAENRLNHDWMNTLMTDESPFYTIPPTVNPTTDVVWSTSRSKVPRRKVAKHPKGVHAWAGVSAYGKTELQFIDEKVNTDVYIGILKKMKPLGGGKMRKLFKKKTWTFQQDGAPAHGARRTNEWLEDNVPDHITSGKSGEWPGSSPDLNWIENIWQ